MSQCNQCCRTPCECMDGDETERAVTTNTDPGAIAREVERLVGEALEAERIRCTRQADRDAARRDAAYLDLRAQLDAVTAQRDGLCALLSDTAERAGPFCSARGILADPHCDDDDCDDCDIDDRVVAALEAAR